MMDWRRYWIALLAHFAVGLGMDRPILIEFVTGVVVFAVVYLALGYLRERR